jgi:hypothetical protein
MGNGHREGTAVRPSSAAGTREPEREERTDKERKKRQRRERKVLMSAQLPLDGWQRIRVLIDLVDEQRNLVEVCDHKARFALVIVGAVNAVLLLVAMRVTPSVAASLGPWLLPVLVPYVAVTFALVVYVVEVLRPRTRDYAQELEEGGRLRFRPGQPGFEYQPLGLFFFTHILRSDLVRYSQLWREARLGQVGAELAVLAHGLAHVNRSQYAALHRVFRGVALMLVLAALLVALLLIAAAR